MNKSISNRVRYGLAYLQAGVFTLLFSNMVWIPYVHAGPDGESYNHNEGNITRNGTTTTINQNVQNMAIDWKTYNVGSSERVQYVQPNSSSISLNRIADVNGSTIQGRIDANGQVILMNPHGVTFSSGSVLNVGGLIATSLNMTNEDFMNGKYQLTQDPDGFGTVINHGIINAAVGGNVALIGKHVENTGLISAKLGSV
ncbi:MAG: filamentous hemagglutinin N-terminal domain-containing protein, partial [Cyclobacteriaceae bacterium]|nr:filamentous hemagglutinin N-terminal domain-containing protein [Cyclobacteriaceae bacterium]